MRWRYSKSINMIIFNIHRLKLRYARSGNPAGLGDSISRNLSTGSPELEAPSLPKAGRSNIRPRGDWQLVCLLTKDRESSTRCMSRFIACSSLARALLISSSCAVIIAIIPASSLVFSKLSLEEIWVVSCRGCVELQNRHARGAWEVPCDEAMDGGDSIEKGNKEPTDQLVRDRLNAVVLWFCSPWWDMDGISHHISPR